MRTLPAEPRIFDFCFPDSGTFLRVQVWEHAVNIRATRDTFTAERKASFIRELAAEGFIADDYRWFSLSSPDSPYRGVEWLVDDSWTKKKEDAAAWSRGFLLSVLVPATLILALLIGLASTGHLGIGRQGPAAPQQNELVGGRGHHFAKSQD